MFDPKTNGPHTAHTLNPVPFIAIGLGDVTLKAGGKLADIAPTMLNVLGIAQPDEMDGDVLEKLAKAWGGIKAALPTLENNKNADVQVEQDAPRHDDI